MIMNDNIIPFSVEQSCWFIGSGITDWTAGASIKLTEPEHKFSVNKS